MGTEAPSSEATSPETTEPPAGAGGCDCKDLVDPKDEGNCKGSINKHFGKVICYVEQPTSCSDARDSVEYAGEKYSALACTVGVDGSGDGSDEGSGDESGDGSGD